MMKATLICACVAGLSAAGAASADVLYTNAWDGNYNLYASQNDTAGFGNFATCYGFFSSGAAPWEVTDVHFYGGYFNGDPAPISGFTINIYSDSGNFPGALLSSTFVAGTANETFVGNGVYRYDALVNATNVTGDAWVSVVPDIAFPPQWGWAAGVDGDPNHAGWQDFFGGFGRTQSLALEITGHVVPAPSSLALIGAAGLVARRRRR